MHGETVKNAHFIFDNFFSLENRAVCEVMWRNMDIPQMTIWWKLFACWILKATNTYSEYVTLIAIPLQ
jgi:hypothetical protein